MNNHYRSAGVLLREDSKKGYEHKDIVSNERNEQSGKDSAAPIRHQHPDSPHHRACSGQTQHCGCLSENLLCEEIHVLWILNFSSKLFEGEQELEGKYDQRDVEMNVTLKMSISSFSVRQ
ncbi:Hypothetical predicted protein [Scomber scombrus]|uniref:Uncharacterized protein n=1 Tax=Scomber scombrus TaxID=13677 RepID=A0AAV1N6I8_SCOSC